MKLVVGLGNPGDEYEGTRHNVGFDFLSRFAYKNNLKFKFKKAFSGFYLIFNNLILLKPTTFMNLSGESVYKVTKFFKIKTSDILIIYDDLDLELGTFKIKAKGSSAGHKGIQSIIDKFNTDEISRFRIGISKAKFDTIDYVLSHFSNEEHKIILDLDRVLEETLKIYDEHDFTFLVSKINKGVKA